MPSRGDAARRLDEFGGFMAMELCGFFDSSHLGDDEGVAKMGHPDNRKARREFLPGLSNL
jgi:hypothetical protein